MPVSAFNVSAAGHETSLSPAEIDRELATMWKPADDEQSPSVTRVVLGNVVWIGARSHFGDALKVFQTVIPKYPCRLFLLVYDPDNQSVEVTASVSAQCFRPEAGKPPVCCEMVHLDFGPNSLRHIRGCVAPLLLPDLQMVLWLGAGVEDLDLSALEQDADRLFTLISRAPNPAEALERCLQAPCPSVDLSWYRMAPIRDQVTAFFDDPKAGFQLERITEITMKVVKPVEGNHLPLVMAAVLVGWLGSCLNWKEGKPTAKAFRYESPTGPVAINVQECEDTPATISSLRMIDSDGEVFQLAMGSENRPMEIVTACPSGTVSERKLWMTELPEAEAIGTALNKRPKASNFNKTAELAIPLLRYYID